MKSKITNRTFRLLAAVILPATLIIFVTCISCGSAATGGDDMQTHIQIRFDPSAESGNIDLVLVKFEQGLQETLNQLKNANPEISNIRITRTGDLASPQFFEYKIDYLDGSGKGLGKFKNSPHPRIPSPGDLIMAFSDTVHLPPPSLITCYTVNSDTCRMQAIQ